MHKLMVDEVVAVCKKIESEGDNQVSKSFSVEQLENCVIEQDGMLKAANQRNLELLAVIKKQRDWIGQSSHDGNCTVLDTDDNGLHYPCNCGLEAVLRCEPSQALREHEAKVLETASEQLDDLWIKGELQTKGAGNELRRMAEERRKK